MKIAIKFIVLLVIFFAYNPSLANADYSNYDAAFCTYSYESIRGAGSCTYHSGVLVEYIQDHVFGCPDYSSEYTYADGEPAYGCSDLVRIYNGDGVIVCYEMLMRNPAIDFMDDVKKGTLQISADIQYSISESWFNNKVQNAGCSNQVSSGASIDDNESGDCANVFDYLFGKLSTKFPLDIFLPAYNFTAGDTACPTITLFGEDLQFCAVVMVASSVKHIFLITFIIRAVIHF